jgi:hypothetical protein
MSAEVVHENKLSTDKDAFESGILKVNPDKRLVTYASLGDTRVSISRGSDGKVRVEIDDTADEDVYVSINSHSITIKEGLALSDKPWDRT